MPLSYPCQSDSHGSVRHPKPIGMTVPLHQLLLSGSRLHALPLGRRSCFGQHLSNGDSYRAHPGWIQIRHFGLPQPPEPMKAQAPLCGRPQADAVPVSLQPVKQSGSRSLRLGQRSCMQRDNHSILVEPRAHIRRNSAGEVEDTITTNKIGVILDHSLAHTS